MNPSIEQLLNVQRVDKEIRFLAEAKRLRPEELSDERKKLAISNSMVEAVVEAIKQGRFEIEKGEHGIKNEDAEIEKVRIALNTAKTNQEYGVFKEQIARHEEKRGEIEEEVLGYLSRIELLEEKKREAERELADQQKIFDRKEAEVMVLVKGLEEQISTLETERSGLIEGLDRDHLELYDRIRNHLDDNAICGVKDHVCQGCFRTVTKQDIAQLMLGEEILQCRSCARLLFIQH